MIPSIAAKNRSFAVLWQLLDLPAEKQPDTELLADLVKRGVITPAEACSMLPASGALLAGFGVMAQSLLLASADPPFPIDPTNPHPLEQTFPEVEELK